MMIHHYPLFSMIVTIQLISRCIPRFIPLFHSRATVRNLSIFRVCCVCLEKKTSLWRSARNVPRNTMETLTFLGNAKSMAMETQICVYTHRNTILNVGIHMDISWYIAIYCGDLSKNQGDVLSSRCCMASAAATGPERNRAGVNIVIVNEDMKIWRIMYVIIVIPK